MTIDIQAEPRAKIPVNLVGTTYQVKPPKMSVLAVVAQAASKGTDDAESMVKHVGTLVKLMFGKEAPAVLARLADEEDDLDYIHVMKCAEKVMEEQTGDPTSSSSASSTE